MQRVKFFFKLLLAALFITAGIAHFVAPDFYVRVVPPYFPWALAIVYGSGAIEILLGALLTVPRWTRTAAWGLVALLILFLPVHLHMAFNPDDYPNINPLLIYLRLPIQGVLILWAWWFTHLPKASGSTTGPHLGEESSGQARDRAD